jgi:hypothetical protein
MLKGINKQAINQSISIRVTDKAFLAITEVYIEQLESLCIVTKLLVQASRKSSR